MTARLTGLVRRELLRPDRPQFAGRGRVPLPAPPDQGRRLRRPAEERSGRAPRALRRLAGTERDDFVELDEIVGYHLERATSYREELGRPAEDLAARAGERLAAAGRRALWREDRRAARALLERALILTRPWRLDVLLEVDLAATLFIEDSRHAIEIVDAAAERAPSRAMRPARRSPARWPDTTGSTSTSAPPRSSSALLLAALPLLEEEANHAALVHVWEVFAISVANARGRWADAARASRAGAGAREAGGPAADRALLDRARARARADSGRRGARAARSSCCPRAPTRTRCSPGPGSSRCSTASTRPSRSRTSRTSGSASSTAG